MLCLQGESLAMTHSLVGRLIIAGCLAAADPAVALDPHKSITQFVVDRWGTQDGLPHNVVRAITQSEDGYLWVATQSGIARFDGMNFTVFDTANNLTFASEDVRDVFQQSNGDLWFATYGGGVVRMRDGKHTRFTASDGLGDDIVRCVREDSAGNLWFCTASGLSRLSNGTFTTYTTDDGLLNNLVYDVFEDQDGNLWVGVLGGVSRLSGDQFTNFKSGRELPADASFVHGFARHPEGGVWMGSYGGGLLRIHDGQVTALTREDGLADDRLSNIMKDSDGNLWISTYDKGVQRFRDGRFELLTTDGGLHSNLPFDVFEDDQKNIWIGSAGGGLHRLKGGPFVTLGSAEGLPDPKVFAVLGEPEGPIWIGTEGGGLHRLVNGEIKTYTTEDGLTNDNVISLARTRNDELWIGTFGGGLNRLREGRFQAWTSEDGLPADQIFTLEPDGQNGLWIGTVNGLAHMRDGTFTTYTKSDGLAKNDIRSLLQDSGGSLWIGTNGGGLNRFDGENFTTFTHEDGLGSNLVYSLHEGSRGAIWIGTKGGGLSRLEEGRLTTFTTEQGLWHNSIYAIVEDNRGDLWLSCPKGVFRVARSAINAVMTGKSERLDIKTFDRSDGLRSGHTVGGSQPAAWHAPDDMLWFATFDGLASVDPKDIHENNSSPTVYLEQLVVNDLALANREEPVLPPGSRNIELHYTAIDLTDPEQVRFRYRLLGLDDSWVQAGSRRVAYYTHLPPGEYRFQVEAATGSGPWTEQNAELRFRLEPRFYQTNTFIVLVALSLISLGWIMYAVRARGLRRSEKQLSLLVGQRTKELEEAKERFERLSKTDALTGLPNRRYFEERLLGEWERAARSGQPIAAIMVDIDHFKQFNDTHGHHAGDECLRRVGESLDKILTRGGDLVARYGGEEFTMLLPETDIRGAKAVAERVRRTIAGLNITWPSAQAAVSITVSAGATAVKPGHRDNPQDFVNVADKALYRAKAKGRNRVEIEVLDRL